MKCNAVLISVLGTPPKHSVLIQSLDHQFSPWQDSHYVVWPVPILAQRVFHIVLSHTYIMYINTNVQCHYNNALKCGCIPTIMTKPAPLAPISGILPVPVLFSVLLCMQCSSISTCSYVTVTVCSSGECVLQERCVSWCTGRAGVMGVVL